MSTYVRDQIRRELMAKKTPTKTQAQRLINAVQWVCVAVIAALLVMHMTGKPPAQRMLIVEIAGGIYFVLFCVDKWLEWKRGKDQEISC
jgi:hypothetical protein